MNIKVIAVLSSIFIAVFGAGTAFAENKAVLIAEEDFRTCQDGTVPTSDWVVDFPSGAEVKNGALRLGGNGDKLTSAAYEIPRGVKNYLKESTFRIIARVKVSNAEAGCGIPYVTDYYGRVICGANEQSVSSGEWNDIVLEVSPYDRSFNVYVNGEAVEENVAYFNTGASYAAVIRFSASGKAEVLVEALSIETTDTSAEAVRNMNFADVSENSWARKYILRLASQGIMVGTDENTFSPKAVMTSGQTAVIMCRIFNIAAETGEEWYSGAVNALTGGGFMEEQSHNTPIMRKDICVIAARLLKNSGIEAAGLVKGRFVDFAALTEEVQESVLTLAALSVISGVSETEFEPYEYVTREQAAKIFSSLADVVPEQ